MRRIFSVKWSLTCLPFLLLLPFELRWLSSRVRLVLLQMKTEMHLLRVSPSRKRQARACWTPKLLWDSFAKMYRSQTGVEMPHLLSLCTLTNPAVWNVINTSVALNAFPMITTLPTKKPLSSTSLVLGMTNGSLLRCTTLNMTTISPGATAVFCWENRALCSANFWPNTAVPKSTTSYLRRRLETMLPMMTTKLMPLPCMLLLVMLVLSRKPSSTLPVRVSCLLLTEAI
mmetsp:Transcript_19131/g.37783  ORF Transcript_19131/g.37783 Transcript_19131/m.37783 type:complete len:229 (-) Transcript_19131:2583-3269(-)